jgi:hypothetical protein
LAPSFIQKPKFQTVDVGQNVMFEAKIVANPGPQVHYFMRMFTENIFIHLEQLSMNINFHLFHLYRILTCLKKNLLNVIYLLGYFRGYTIGEI